MRQQTVEIRLELLKKIGQGFSQKETCKHLMETFGITESGARYHFRTKKRWIKDYINLGNVENLQQQLFQHFNHIYREASFHYLNCQDHNGRIGYLRTMLEAAKCMQSFLPDNVDTSVNDIRQTLENFSWDLSKMKYLKEEELKNEQTLEEKHAYFRAA